MERGDERDPGRGRLRVGVVLDSYDNVSAWIASIIEDLSGADFVEIVVRVALGAQKEAANGTWRDWLFRKYAAWDERRAVLERDPLRRADVPAGLAAIPSVEVPEPGGAEALRAYNLDVLVWLAPSDPAVALRTVARSGLWRFRHGTGVRYGLGADYFDELSNGIAVSGSSVEVLQGDDAALVCQTVSSTERGWSLRQNQAVPYWRAASSMLRCLRRLHENQRLPEIEQEAKAQAGASMRLPTNRQMAGFLLRNVVRTVTRRVRYSSKESYWFVAYRIDRSKFLSQTEEINLSGFQQIRAPDGHFYADPFVIEWNARQYLFVEDYLFAEQRGCISVMEISTQGVTSEVTRVLDLPYHLSYPFVFEHEGGLWMIPETLGAGRIDLYRATNEPTQWEFVKSLQEGVQAVDTTVWIENGRFYFFTNIAERGSTVNDELRLFYADELLGEWTPHPQNPICTDVRRSRGAGKLFRRNGKLIRPAQDCSVRYGFACQFSEVEVLTPTEYRERPVGRIEPDWYPGLIGTHTVNSNDAVEVIDGQVYRRRYTRARKTGDYVRDK